VFNAADETGLAGRITLNNALRAETAEPWRWRDGINAATQGDSGQADLLLELRANMNATVVPGSVALGSTPRSLVGHIQELSSDVAANRIRFSDASETASSYLNDVRNAVAADGVNTDQELQKLIELEKSYAANARVVQVVDDMLSELLRI
jgi:flagellar hook-associated protein 1 FlgK